MGKITALELKALTEQDADRKLRDGNGIIGLLRVKNEGGVSVSFGWRYRYDGKVKQVIGRRVAILYGSGIFACRHCDRLAYPSQHKTDDDRAGRQAFSTVEDAIQKGCAGEPSSD